MTPPPLPSTKSNQRFSFNPINDRSQLKILVWVIVGTIFFGFWLLIFSYTPNNDAPKVAAKVTIEDYKNYVTNYIVDNLNDPDSYQPVKWIEIARFNDEKLGPNSIMLYHRYRAKNGFGALVLQYDYNAISEDGQYIEERTKFMEALNKSLNK